MNRRTKGKLAGTALIVVLLMGLGGCASMVTERLTGNLSMAILNQDDPETVRAGAPAYLLLIDGLIEGEPRSAKTLLAGARLYTAYAAVFVEEPTRSRQMSSKARAYAQRALCADYSDQCDLAERPYAEFLEGLKRFDDKDDLPYLYTYATSWLLWIQKHSDDWSAVGDIPKVKSMLQHVVALQDDYQDGQPYLYLGVLETILPPSLGGKPDLAREDFAHAIALSGGRDLSMQVALAKYYARLVFDKELHDTVLKEVLDADPYVPGLTLTNTLAQREAKELLATSNDYFME